MSIAKENEEVLTQFLEEVWNAGDIEASDKYIAEKYTIHHASRNDRLQGW